MNFRRLTTLRAQNAAYAYADVAVVCRLTVLAEREPQAALSVALAVNPTSCRPFAYRTTDRWLSAQMVA